MDAVKGKNRLCGRKTTRKSQRKPQRRMSFGISPQCRDPRHSLTRNQYHDCVFFVEYFFNFLRSKADPIATITVLSCIAMKLFRRSKLHCDTQKIDCETKGKLKEIEEKLIQPIGIMIKLQEIRLTNAKKYTKCLTNIADVLNKFSSTDFAKDPSQTHYSSVLKVIIGVLDFHIADLDLWIKESHEQFLKSITNFKNELVEKVKNLKKSYEKCIENYSSCLNKLEILHNSKKSVEITKLYLIEKERVRLKRLYEDSVNAINEEYEYMNEKFNLDFLNMLIDEIKFYANSFQQSNEKIVNLKDFIQNTKNTCENEKLRLKDYRIEKETQRKEIYEEQLVEATKSFLENFDIKVVDIIGSVLKSECSLDIKPHLGLLCEFYGMDALTSLNMARSSITPQIALNSISDAIKNNIPAISIKMIENELQDKLLSICDTLAKMQNQAEIKAQLS